jgi:hypothetical protein
MCRRLGLITAAVCVVLFGVTMLCGARTAQSMKTEELLSKWLRDYSATLPPQKGLLRIRRAEPRFQYHNYFARFKVEIATLDGTGQKPSDVTCMVVEVSETDQTAKIDPNTRCDSIHDL